MENNNNENKDVVTNEAFNNEVNVANPDAKMEKSKRIAQTFAVLSLIFMCVFLVGTPVIGYYFNTILSRTSWSDTESGLSLILTVISDACSLFAPVSVVMMIIARVKDKTNKMAKVLMWIWIILGGLFIIMFILVILLFAAICGSCAGMFT